MPEGYHIMKFYGDIKWNDFLFKGCHIRNRKSPRIVAEGGCRIRNELSTKLTDTPNSSYRLQWTSYRNLGISNKKPRPNPNRSHQGKTRE